MPHGKLALVIFLFLAFGWLAWRVFQWRWSNTQHPYLLNGRDR